MPGERDRHRGVWLVDANNSAIGRITPDGVKTSADEIELDMIIYATGFDAVTGR